MASDRSLRLRTRVTLFFALIALFAGLVLIGVTYGFARNNLLDERSSSAKQQAFDNASEVADQLDAALVDPEVNVGDYFVNDLRTEPGGFAVLVDPRSQTDVTHPLSDFPPELVEHVEAGGSAIEYTSIDGDDYVTVGTYIRRHDTGYLEAFPADNERSTLTALLTALALGGAGTLLLATLFGYSTSRRLLRPISRVADAAEDIASGGLDTRLESESDPDLDRLANSFNDMADAVQTKIELEARFASDVSHELRSPITALTAAVEVLDAKREDIPERTQQALDVVVSQVRRFDSMVIDLLELSRLDAGATDLTVETLDIITLTDRVAARFGSPDIEVDVDPATPREIDVDKVRFERVLGNLIENANHHGGGALRVEVVPTGRGMLRFAVEDGGPGVAQSERDRIFERFARGSAARHRIGTGLGLALASEHSSAMGGAVWVEDRPGGGARFVFEIPSRRNS
ncbi:HAMP domain-containing sensor histidine kinase [Ilumatobacter nonamiensis]|uniref:HAMP domain-containing sensor histidine kinase n=1 Tax=Ilumatobacter nonamiensis TaxID=467093 RepID=UPI000347F635|nr:HAMP domain-containing sensor histidine kinase [Ilumatobacter nonamiensis]